MVLDIDTPPTYNPITGGNNEYVMNDLWISWFNSFYQTLVGYLSGHGMFLPQITESQKISINAPINGQMIYNTTTNTAEYFKAGAWTPF